MKRTRQHEIDDEAQAVFRSELPSAWACGEFRKDYGKDYFVELVEENELSGRAFVVQLKGSERPRMIRGGSVVSFPMNVDHLSYYGDKVEVPVFLVVVDVSTRKAYWLFVQEHLDTSLAERCPGWREQTVATLHVPVANDLSGTPRLRAAVNSALGYMKSKYPGRVEDAIIAAKRELEESDPRFAVEVSVQDGRTIRTMHAREDVEFSLSMKGDKDVLSRKYEEMIDQGRLVDLTEVAAVLVGLPPVSGSGRVARIQFQRELPLEVRITLLGSDGGELRTLETISGNAVGGVKEMRLNEPLGQSILTMKLTIQSIVGSPPIRAYGAFGFNLVRWVGKRFSILPYFEQVDALVQHLASGGELRWSVSTQGNHLFDIRSRHPIGEGIHQVSEYCSIFRVARNIARWSGIDPVVPKVITPAEIDDLFQIADLIDPERRVVNYPRMELSWEMSREAVRAELEGCNSLFGKAGQARVVSAPLKFTFLGLLVELKGLVADISAVHFQQTVDDMRVWLEETDEAVARLTAVSASDATLTKTIGEIRQQPREG